MGNPLKANHERINLKDLLSKQYLKGQYNRMDIIVRYMAIEEYYGKSDQGYTLYNKMQQRRKKKKHNLERFKELIKSFEQNGYDLKSAVIVDENYQLVDGSHRLACALYFNVKEISVKKVQHNKDIKYALDWFDEGFNKKERTMIQYKKKKIFLAKRIV